MKVIARLLFLGLLVTLVSCSGSKHSSSNRGDYKTACQEGDFEEAHKILDELHYEFVETWNENYGSIDWKNDNRSKIEAAAKDYASAATYVLGYEARYMINSHEDNLEARLNNLFSEIEPMGEKLIEGTEYHPKGVNYLQQACAQFNCYKEYVAIVNSLCKTIYSTAQQTDDSDLQNLAESHLLDTPSLIDNEKDLDDVITYVPTQL